VAYGVLEIWDLGRRGGGEGHAFITENKKSVHCRGVTCVHNESVVFNCRPLSSSDSYWFWCRNVWVKIDGHFSFYFSALLRK
jgi:hypothetical protein